MTVSLILPVCEGLEFGLHTNKPITADDVQHIADIHFYDQDGFMINQNHVKISSYFKKLMQEIISSIGVEKLFEPTQHVSIYVWRTEQELDNALDFVRKHAYEIFAMLGEEKDWRNKKKTTVQERIRWGMTPSTDDFIIPAEYTSIVFDNSPDYIKFFNKRILNVYTLLDSHIVASISIFKILKNLVSDAISECISAEEKKYPKSMKKVNNLLLRYLFLKDNFYNVDHYWKDTAYLQYINYQISILELKKDIEALEKSASELREIIVQMAEMVRHKQETRVSQAMQIVGIAISASIIIELIKIAGESFNLTSNTQFWLSILTITAFISSVVLWVFRERLSRK